MQVGPVHQQWLQKFWGIPRGKFKFIRTAAVLEYFIANIPVGSLRVTPQKPLSQEADFLKPWLLILGTQMQGVSAFSWRKGTKQNVMREPPGMTPEIHPGVQFTWRAPSAGPSGKLQITGAYKDFTSYRKLILGDFWIFMLLFQFLDFYVPFSLTFSSTQKPFPLLNAFPSNQEWQI